MEIVQQDMWKTFIDKTEELFVFGYKLPSALQIKAVSEVQNKLVDWKNTLSRADQTDSGACDNCDHERDVEIDGQDNSVDSHSHKRIYNALDSTGSAKDRTKNNKGTLCVKRRRTRKRKGKCKLPKVDKKNSSSENTAETVDDLLSHSENDDEFDETDGDVSNKATGNDVINNLDNHDVDNHHIRQSKRIKVRKKLDTNTDKEDVKKESSLRISKDETIVKLEAQENSDWKNDNATSAEDHKPVTQRKRGRPRKLQSLLNNIFEGLNLTHKCSKCSKSYGTPEVLECHMEIHKDKMPLVCLTCGKTYNSKGGFDNHIRTHDPNNQIQCPHCEFRYPNYTVMNRHVLIKHASVNSRPFLCDLCGKGFLQPSTLKVHMSTHDVEKNFACDQCKFRTHTKNILAVHKKNIHSEKEYYTCDLCDVRVKYKGSLIEHRRRHFGEKPHQCSVCSSRFTSRSQLAQHVRIHKEKTFVCNQCDKKFIDRHKLARHMTIHTGEKAYSCGFCNYQCNVRGNIRKHWLFVHKIDHDRRMQRVKVINTNGTYEEKMLKSSSDMRKGHEKEADVTMDINQTEMCNNLVSNQKSVGDNGRGDDVSREQNSYPDGTVVLSEMSSDRERFQGSVPILSDSAGLSSVLTETELPANGMIGNNGQQTITETVIDDEKVLELPVMGNNLNQEAVSLGVVAQDGIYPSDLGLETKVEMGEDGTQYVYVYFPVNQLPSHSTVPTASSEEYVVTVEETETQQASLGLPSMI